MKKLPASYLEPKIFNNQFIVKNKISSGSFGVVYFAVDKNTKEEVAIKCEKEAKHEAGTLDREIYLLKKLAGISGIPKVHWHGCEQNYNVIVMELLGKDLAYYINKYKKISLKSGLQLAEQLVEIMKQIHVRGVMHRDLKPENILFGIHENGNKLYLADYGVSKQFIEQGKHVPFRDKKSFIGTTRYASCAAHRGDEIGRKDDLESLFYVIIYSILGFLFHSLLSKENYHGKIYRILGIRIELLPLEKLKWRQKSMFFVKIFQSLVWKKSQYFSHFRELTFSQEPDYDFIKKNIADAANDKLLILDGLFEWSDLKLKQIVIEKSNQVKIDKAPQSPVRLKEAAIPEQPRVNSFLQVPDFQLGQSSPQNTSHSGVGSFSSMRIKYIPTQMQDQQSQKNHQILQNQSELENDQRNDNQIMKIAISQPHIDLQKSANQHSQFQCSDTINGFGEDIEENIENQMSLDQKYQQLQQLQVQASFKEQKDYEYKIKSEKGKKISLNNGKKKLNI